MANDALLYYCSVLLLLYLTQCRCQCSRTHYLVIQQRGRDEGGRTIDRPPTSAPTSLLLQFFSPTLLSLLPPSLRSPPPIFPSATTPWCVGPCSPFSYPRVSSASQFCEYRLKRERENFVRDVILKVEQGMRGKTLPFQPSFFLSLIVCVRAEEEANKENSALVCV